MWKGPPKYSYQTHSFYKWGNWDPERPRSQNWWMTVFNLRPNLLSFKISESVLPLKEISQGRDHLIQPWSNKKAKQILKDRMERKTRGSEKSVSFMQTLLQTYYVPKLLVSRRYIKLLFSDIPTYLHIITCTNPPNQNFLPCLDHYSASLK